MIRIVLDVSANTFKNDIVYFNEMVTKIKEIDRGLCNIVFKTQLFKNDSEAAKINTVLDHDIFDGMYNICKEHKYELTSSVFDKESLDFLLHYNIPFVKIACRPDLYYLVKEIPKYISIYMSIDCRHPYKQEAENIIYLNCIPEYPAKTIDYIKNIYEKEGERTMPLFAHISDHTKDLNLFRYWKGEIDYINEMGISNLEEYDIFEMHYVLEHTADNPDAGPFAKTIDDLRNIL